MNNQFDDLLGIGENKSREEAVPNVLSRLHKVPKQIVDTCVSIGGNLKLIESGMPAPVLLPSQIAHDRILTIGDGIADAFVISLVLYITTLFGFNIATVPMLILFFLYWGFHIAWWQESLSWRGIKSVDEYLAQTYRYYMPVLLLFVMVFSTAMSYGAYKYDIANKITTTFEIKAEGFSSFFKKNGSENQEDKDIFASLKDPRPIQPTAEAKKNEIIKVSQETKNFGIVLLQYLSSMILFLVISFFIYKFYKNKYVSYNDRMHTEAEKELNSDVKNRQNALREALD
jgi:hypothetical protein